MTARWRTITTAALAVLLAAAGACSSSMGPPPGGGGDGGEVTEEDCDDGEILHPIHEECVEENDGTQNDGIEDNDNSSAVPPEDCGPGAIKGQACRPDGELLPSAEVTIEGVDCDGEPFTETTTTDPEGYYEFDGIPAGDHDLRIESGSFETTRSVTVKHDEVTDLQTEAAKICVQDTGISIAILEGRYDDISEILDNLDISNFETVGSDAHSGGSQAVQEAAAFLGDIDEMREHDIIFIECGELWTDLSDGYGTDEFVTNIRDYVEAGNSLYVSDHAHPFLQSALPEAIDFYNEGDGEPTSAWAGKDYTDGDSLEARVISDDLETALGMETIDLRMIVGWAIAEGVGPDTTVHFEADAETDPLWTNGDVIYDAPMLVHYEDPGTVEGNAIFTSFHNAEQADDEIERVMEYMIFQL